MYKRGKCRDRKYISCCLGLGAEGTDLEENGITANKIPFWGRENVLK